MTDIPDRMFLNCSYLENIILPASITEIGSEVFYNCKYLKKINFPQSLVTIGSDAFANCTQLKTVTIPSTVNSISYRAFKYCTQLSAIFVKNEIPIDLTQVTEVFNGVDVNTCKLYVPIGSVSSYKNALQWKDFFNIIEGDGFIVSDSLITYSALAATSSIDVTTEAVNWTATSDQSWLTINPQTTLSGNGNFSITASLNSDTNRTATITLAAKGATTSYIKISQTAIIKKTVDCIAGKLDSLLTYSEKNEVSRLTITGTIDARDFKIMRDYMPLLVDLDISTATIVAYTGHKGTSNLDTIYVANTIPESALNGKKTLTSLLLPESITSIDSYAFSNCTGLTSLKIPESVSLLGKSAFSGCSGLTSFTIPKLITNIEAGTFMGCNGLLSMILPDSLDTIGISAFSFCSKLQSITIPNTVTSIGEDAFGYCQKLVTVNIPTSVSTIGSRIFNNCISLTLVTINGPVKTIPYDAFYACSSLKSITIPETVTTIDSYAFYQCSSLNAINIPASVTTLGEYAFYYCLKLNTFSFPALISSIGNVVLWDCQSIKSIYSYATTPLDLSSSTDVFRNIHNTDCILYVPIGSKSLYQNAVQWKNFYTIIEWDGFSLSSNRVMLKNQNGSSANVSIMSNSNWTANSDQTWLTLNSNSGTGNGIVTLSATANTGLKRSAIITVSSANSNKQTIIVTQTDDDTQIAVSSTSIPIPYTLTTASIDVFSNTTWIASSDQPWLSVTPNTTTTGNVLLSYSAEANNGIARNATITLSANGIENTTILISQAGNSIIQKTISNVAGTLTTVLSSTDKMTITNLKLTGTIDARDFKTMRDSMPVLKEIDLNEASIIEYIGTLGTFGITSKTYGANSIPAYAFQYYGTSKNNTQLTKITLPSSLIEISAFAFANCTSLNSIIIPPSVLYLRRNCFQNCISFSSITIPSLVNTLEPLVFYQSNCSVIVDQNNPNFSSVDGVLFDSNQLAILYVPASKINNYTIPSTVVSVGSNAFRGCSNLTSITIPSSVMTINDAAFYSCSGLKTLEIPTSVLSIGYDAFDSSIGLTSMDIPSSITTIESQLFYNCSGLKSITIPSSIQAIKSYSFANCNKLTTLTIPSSVQTIDYNAFYNCTSLTSIYSLNPLPIDLKNLVSIFLNVDKTLCTLFVPPGSKSAYQSASVWMDFKNIVEFSLLASPINLTVANKISSTASTSITSNLKWTASSDQSWLSVNPSVPTNGNATLTVTADANLNPISRIAKVTVIAEGVPSQTITVTQSAANPTLSLSKNKISYLNPLLSVDSVVVNSNSLWTATTNQTWLTLNVNSLTGIGTLICTASENQTIVSRSAIITIAVAGITSQTITVTQVAGNATLIVSKNNINFTTFNASKDTIKVTSNANWSVSSNQSWLTISKNTVDFICSASTNTIAISRTATVTVNVSGAPAQTITITQAAANPIVSIINNSYSISSNSSNTSIPITSNSTWIATVDQSWVTLNPSTSFTGNGNLNFTVSSNSGNQRSATILISVSGLQAQTITVTQAPGNIFLSVSKSTFTTPNAKEYVDTILVTTNTTWNISTAQSWLSCNKVSGFGNDTIFVTIARNTTSFDRVASVTITGTGISNNSVNYFQEKPYAYTPINGITVEDTLGSTNSIQVYSNTLWTIHSDQSWISIDTSHFLNDMYTVTFNASQNNGDIRFATIQISADGVSSSSFQLIQYKSSNTKRSIQISAGELERTLSLYEKNIITDLTLSGTIDARDFRIMRDSIPNLSNIDLTNATILAYGGFQGTNFNNPDSVYYNANTIPVNAFFNVYDSISIMSIKLPLNTVSVDSFAFYSCQKLKTISLPSTVINIGSNAFGVCPNLDSIFIPSSVTNIGNIAFNVNSGIVTVDALNQYYSSLDGILFNKKQTELIHCPINRTGNYTIPSTVTNIESFAFIECRKLLSISIPTSVTNIGEFAFDNCIGITSFSFPNSITNIGNGAFQGCSGLTTIAIPSSITSISNQTFESCSNLSKVDLPSTIRTIGINAFNFCSNLTSISITNSVSRIGDGAFSSCSKLKYLSIPSSVLTIGNGAFSGCSNIDTLNIQSSDIKNGAFAGCYSLTSLTLTSLVDTIENSAFTYCSSLKSIYSYNVLPIDLSKYTSVFTGIDTINCILYVPSGSKSLYQSANQWKAFVSIIEMGGTNLLISTPSLSFSHSSSSSNVDITSNTTWDATSDVNWITITPSNGNGDGTISVTPRSNPTTSARTALVTISSSDGTTKTFTVSQAAGEPIISVPSTTVSIANSSTATPVSITSNTTWDARTDVNWLTITPANGNGDGLISVTPSANLTTLARTATVTISSPDGTTKTFSVSQVGADPIITLQKTTISFTDTLSSDSVIITSNGLWTAQSDVSWLIVSPESGTGNDTIIIKTQTNTTGIVRTGTVTISSNAIVALKADASQTITVTQAAKTETGFVIEHLEKRYYHIIGNTVYFENKETSIYTILGQRLSAIGDKSITLPVGIYIICSPFGNDKFVINRN